MTRLAFGRVFSVIAAILFWVWLLVKVVLDWIGRTTVFDDLNLLLERLPLAVSWLLQTPWPVPAFLAATLTIFLIWLSLPSVQPARAERLGSKPVRTQVNPARYTLPEATRFLAELDKLDKALITYEDAVLRPCSDIATNFEARLAINEQDWIAGIMDRVIMKHGLLQDVISEMSVPPFADEVTYLLGDQAETLSHTDHLIYEYDQGVRLLHVHKCHWAIWKLSLIPRNKPLAEALAASSAAVYVCRKRISGRKRAIKNAKR